MKRTRMDDDFWFLTAIFLITISCMFISWFSRAIGVDFCTGGFILGLLAIAATTLAMKIILKWLPFWALACLAGLMLWIAFCTKTNYQVTDRVFTVLSMHQTYSFQFFVGVIIAGLPFLIYIRTIKHLFYLVCEDITNMLG